MFYPVGNLVLEGVRVGFRVIVWKEKNPFKDGKYYKVYDVAESDVTKYGITIVTPDTIEMKRDNGMIVGVSDTEDIPQLPTTMIAKGCLRKLLTHEEFYLLVESKSYSITDVLK